MTTQPTDETREARVGESAFVVWIDSAREGECRGRVEHVSTATRTRFASRQELLDFLLAAGGSEAPAPAGKDPGG